MRKKIYILSLYLISFISIYILKNELYFMIPLLLILYLIFLLQYYKIAMINNFIIVSTYIPIFFYLLVQIKSPIVFIYPIIFFLTNLIINKLTKKKINNHLNNQAQITSFIDENISGIETTIAYNLYRKKLTNLTSYLKSYEKSLLYKNLIGYLKITINIFLIILYLLILYNNYSYTTIVNIILSNILLIMSIYLANTYNYSVKNNYNYSNNSIKNFKSITISNLMIPNLLYDFNLTINKNDKIYIIVDNKDYLPFIDTFINQNLNYEGEILIDNNNIKEINTLKLIDINYDWLKNTSLINNLLYNKEIPYEELESILKEYQLDHYIKSLPNEEGTIISDIEYLPKYLKKILTIIRSIISNKKLLIINNPFIDISANYQKEIEKSISKQKNKTIIIISHKLPLIQTYNKIIYLENSQIKEIGTDKELMEQKGKYYRLKKEKSQ